MSEYKRITVRTPKGIKLKKGRKYVELFSDKSLTLNALNYLAELEDEIESGSRLKLPCKVGDMIYVPWVWKGVDGIMTLTVSEISIFEQFIQIACSDLETDDFEFERQFNFGMFYDYDFGKIWFIDIKAAKERLKEIPEAYK